jgi:ligand-binding sensor domain-containing protein
MTSYRTYYQGHPAFVSGGYIPGFDAERFWGYVDGLYIPSKVTTYAPFVVSTEHGLFTWGGYHGVWHHFLPHYWGANSAWLDTRDLIPHRRPTCMLEDAAGNLWVGTDGDGIVRFNAHAREYFRRDPEHNQKDRREFSTFGTNEVGCGFDSVVGLSSSGTDHPLWVLVQSRQGKIWLARYHEEKWSTLPLEHKARCLVEVEPGVVLIGTDHGLMKVNFETRKTERLRGFDDTVFNNIFGIAVTAHGTVLCASYWAFSEKTKTRTN